MTMELVRREIEPMVWEMVDRPRFASHLAHSEDGRRRIVAAIVAYVTNHLDAFDRARRMRPHLSFERWLRLVAKQIAMSYRHRDAVPVRTRRTPHVAMADRGVRRVW